MHVVPILSLPLIVNMLCKSYRYKYYVYEFFFFIHLLVFTPILHPMPMQLKDSAVCVVSIDERFTAGR